MLYSFAGRRIDVTVVSSDTPDGSRMRLLMEKKTGRAIFEYEVGDIGGCAFDMLSEVGQSWVQGFEEMLERSGYSVAHVDDDSDPTAFGVYDKLVPITTKGSVTL